MTRGELLIELDGLMVRPVGSTREDEPLAEIPEWDSIAMLSFIALADAQMAVRLSGSQITACDTIGDLIQLVEPKLQG
ncbi:MAG: hypothetical protein ACRC1K_01165 [Planctomycetia bacterium]